MTGAGRQKVKMRGIMGLVYVSSVLLLLTPFVYSLSSMSGVGVTLNKCCPPGTSFNYRTHECIHTKVQKLEPQSQSQTPQKNSSDTLQISENLTESPNSNVYNDNEASSSFDSADSIVVSKSSLHLIHEHDVDIDSYNLTSSSFNRADNNNEKDDVFEFKLMTRAQAPRCSSKGNFTVQINIKNSNDSSLDNSYSGYPPKLTSMGFLRIGLDYYSTPEYCLAGVDGDILSILVCNATCGAGTPCIRKCCPMDKIWKADEGKRQMCIPAGSKRWTPVLYMDPKRKASHEMQESLHPHYQIVHPREFCRPGVDRPSTVSQYDKHGHKNSRFRILTNGELIRRISRYTWNSTAENRSVYCVDGGSFEEQDYSGNSEWDSILFDCGPEMPREDAKTQSIFYAAMMIFSCIFLLLTMLVYILLWEKQNVHGWTLMCYVTSLFFMYLFFILLYFSELLIRQRPDGKPDLFCHTVAVGLNFFFVSTFCWMTVINFDLFTKFKSLKPTSGRSKGLKRFLAYTCFALGVPISIITVGLSLDSAYGHDDDSGIIVPLYGQGRCQLDPEYAQLVYSYGPAGVLLAFNCLFFTFTVYTMYQIQQSTKFATSSSSKNNQQAQSVRLFGKLLVLMGIPWIFEIISWAVEHNRVTDTSWYWVVFDLVNILQAIAIFYIFVCKRDIIHSLEQKYPPFKRLLDRVLLDSERADEIGEAHPKLKGFIKPITRRAQEQTSVGRSVHTETTMSSIRSDSLRRASAIGLQTRNQTTIRHPSTTTKQNLDVDNT